MWGRDEGAEKDTCKKRERENKREECKAHLMVSMWFTSSADT